MKRTPARSKQAGATAQQVLNDPRWQAVLQRDRAADGAFFYSVKSTGIFCRPGCSSRTPRPENVQFHTSANEAAGAGFRPCQRCRPEQLLPQQDAAIVDVCRAIEEAISAGRPAPPLQHLASQVGLSRFHLQRVFRQGTGLTPKQYSAARRAAHLRRNLKGSNTVTDTIYETGFHSASNFYSAATTLGMTPTQFRNGAQGTRIHYSIGSCSLGELLVARTQRGLCAIHLADTADALRNELQLRFPNAHLREDAHDLSDTLQQVIEFVESRQAKRLQLPLDIQGTAFQQRVWRALQEIPAGSSATYTEIAARIGSPRAVRAVAGACAANPLAVAIPCHRVVRSNGELSGYRWGVNRKKTLLERECAKE